MEDCCMVVVCIRERDCQGARGYFEKMEIVLVLYCLLSDQEYPLDCQGESGERQTTRQAAEQGNTFKTHPVHKDVPYHYGTFGTN